jgi:hypothetical protein
MSSASNATWFNANLYGNWVGSVGLDWIVDAYLRGRGVEALASRMCVTLAMATELFPWLAQGRGTDLPEQNKPKLPVSPER